MSYRVYKFTWEGIEIETSYAPLKWATPIFEIETVESARAPLPITATGYLSHHHQPNTQQRK